MLDGRRTLFAVVGLLSAVALFLLVFDRGGEDGTRPSPGPAEPTGVGDPAKPETGPPPSRNGPGDTTSESPGPPDTHPTPMRVRIRGKILGPPPGQEKRTRVRVAPLGWRSGSGVEPIVERVAEDGTFSLDASSLFVEDSRPSEIQIRADHPDFLPASERLAVEEAVARKEEGATYDVEIVLPPAGIVTGEVRDEAGRPVPGAAVSLHPIERDKPREAAIDATTTGADGTYRLRGRPDVSHLVAAAKDGLVPATAPVLPALAGDTLASPLVLTPGVTISGRVTLAGKPVEGATLTGWAKWREGKIVVGSHELTWNDDGVVLWRATGTTDADGRYRIGGLTPGPHRVQIGRVPDLNLSAALNRSLELRLDAPADDADFEIEGVDLTVQIRAEGRPVPGISVLLIQGGSILHVSIGEEGKAHLFAQPGEPVEIVVTGEGYEEFHRTVAMPGAGATMEEVVDLEKERPRPVLNVVLETPEGHEVTHAGFGFFARDARRDFPSLRRDVVAKDGRFRIDDVDPGHWRVAVRPGGDWFGGRGYWQEAEAEVDLPREGEVELRIPIRQGGRLRISAKDEDGSHLPAECAIRAADGRELDVHFAFYSPGGVGEGGSPLDGNGPSEVATALPPGEYTVDLWLDGYFRESRKVRIEAGETAEVAVTLRRR